MAVLHLDRPPDDADEAAWDALRQSLAGEKIVTATLGLPETFELVLPSMPDDARDLRAMIARHAPVRPADLVWTPARLREHDGAAVVTLARKDKLRSQCAIFERRLGRAVHPVCASSGERFNLITPLEQTRYRITGVTVALSLVAVLIGLQNWTQVHRPAPPATAAPGLPEAFSRPGFAARLRPLAEAGLPKDKLAQIAQEPTGGLVIEFATDDPDLLRANLGKAGGLTGFVEASQARESDAAYRVRFRESAQASAPPVQLTRAVPPLLGASQVAAQDTVIATLKQRAESMAVRLRLLPAGEQQDGVVRLGIEVSGPQNAVVAFADRLESTSPAMRLADWKLVPDLAGVRLSGTLVAPWARNR